MSPDGRVGWLEPEDPAMESASPVDAAEQREVALRYAGDQRNNHCAIEKSYQVCFIGFQAVATLMAVDETLSPISRIAVSFPP
jgi:hypothetical protein